MRIWDNINNLKYRLSPMRIYRCVSGEKLVQWFFRDAPVVKQAALHADITGYLYMSAVNITGGMFAR